MHYSLKPTEKYPWLNLLVESICYWCHSKNIYMPENYWPLSLAKRTPMMMWSQEGMFYCSFILWNENIWGSIHQKLPNSTFMDCWCNSKSQRVFAFWKKAGSFCIFLESIFCLCGHWEKQTPDTQNTHREFYCLASSMVNSWFRPSIVVSSLECYQVP